MKASVIIATYNRKESTARMLTELEAQTQSKKNFEVIVVDDGSKEDPRPYLQGFGKTLKLHLERRPNGGPGAARQTGADVAKGELLIFVDDDMKLPPQFVAAHIRAHEEKSGDTLVLMGSLKPDDGLAAMPLFERFYARNLDRMAERYGSGSEAPRGPDLYTGNLSLPRALFLKAGGFDTSLKLIEDAELGVRLEKHGAVFAMSREAYSVHASDHRSLDKWLARTVIDGASWAKLARKHPDAPHANPWRHFGSLSLLSRPLLALVIALPVLALPLAKTAFRASESFDKLGLEKIALAGTTLTYGIQYYHGVRSESPSLGEALREYRAFQAAAKALSKQDAEAESLWSAIRKDHEALTASQGKYGGGAGKSDRSIASDAVTNIGFQLLVAYRVMRAFRAQGNTLAAKFCARLIRHAYGSDIHWDATFEPGIVIVHGFGLAIHGDAYVSAGCILFQHVTLGRGLDPETKHDGSPRLEANVHVGVGATLVGPLTIGARSKIMPGCTVTRSAPENSVIESPAPTVRTRG
jgi:serine acetyltransferase/glycosyltransferase involved in cell wall biosynthesis